MKLKYLFPLLLAACGKDGPSTIANQTCGLEEPIGFIMIYEDGESICGIVDSTSGLSVAEGVGEKTCSVTFESYQATGNMKTKAVTFSDSTGQSQTYDFQECEEQ